MIRPDIDVRDGESYESARDRAAGGQRSLDIDAARQRAAEFTARHQQPARAAQQPPTETGKRLATIARPGRNGTADAELRITLDEFQGRPFIGARVWERSNDGSWWPTKKGLSIRVRELGEVVAALLQAMDEADGKGGGR